MSQELKILIPAEEVSTSQGKVVVQPFKFKDFPKALSLISKYVDTYVGAESTYEIAQKLLSNGGEETLADVSSLLSIVSGKDRAFLDELTWDEVFELLLVTIQQNIDFFNRMGEKLRQNLTKKDLNPTTGEKQLAA